MTDKFDSDSQITSIADAVIKLKEIRESNKNLNEPDIEEKFARLSLAFRTDKFTLAKRLDLQQRQRDIAEKNIESELKSLRESLNALNQLCADSDMREVITKTQQHVDIVQQTTARMSSRAETFGAIQQEQRMNSAFETMLSYVDHLKLLYDKEHMELEEYRRLLTENNLLPDNQPSADSSDETKRSLLQPRSHSLSGSSKPDCRSRLLSAVCLLTTPADPSPALNGNNTTPQSRRASMPIGPSSIPSQQTPHGHTKLIPAVETTTSNVTDKTKPDTESQKTVKGESIEDSPEAKNDDDCDLCRGVPSSVHRSSFCHPTLKDSRERQLSCESSFDEKDDGVPPFPSLSTSSEKELLSSDEGDDSVMIDSCTSLTLSKFLRWTINSGSWSFDSNTIMLRLRYLLAVIFAVAAVLSLILTFVPRIANIAFA